MACTCRGFDPLHQGWRAACLAVGLTGVAVALLNRALIEEHERGLAVQGLRELEFDRQTGKLSDADYESLHDALEQRALAAIVIGGNGSGKSTLL